MDHVPPKCLFAKPLPQNMLTVPCCSECNSGFTTDDEYTRVALALDVRAASHGDVIGGMPSLMRWLANPGRRGFARYLAGQMKPLPIVGPNGAVIVKATQDVRRIDATGERIVRGIYYIQKRQPVPKSALVKVASRAGMTASDPDMLMIARVFRAAPERRDGAVGRAFSYAVALADRRTVWLMLLYDYFFWVGIVDERDVVEREADLNAALTRKRAGSTVTDLDELARIGGEPLEGSALRSR